MILKFLQLLFIGSSLLFSMPTFAAQMGSDYRETPKADKSILWLKSPKPMYTNADLDGQNRDFNCRIYANRDGVVTRVEILKSTGLDNLDHKIVEAVYEAKLFNPYQVEIILEQPFQLKLYTEEKGYFDKLFELLFKK